MTREEAIEIVKTQYSHDSVMKTALGMLIPELCESSDEIIRSAMIKGFNFLMVKREINTFAGTPIRNILAYLEKQENAFENGRQFGIMQEQARQELEWPDEKQKEQKPEIKYVYPKFRKGDVIEPITPNGHFTPVRVVDIWNNSYSCRSDDGNAYLSLPIKHEDEYRLVKQKPTEKQDYSRLNDLERAIHRGFLAAGIENVSVTIIKETAQDCLAQMKSAEWSEEDKKFLQVAISCTYDRGYLSVSNWLKSLRPSWKPSEEQMNCLCAAVDAAIRKHNESISGYEPARVLKSLYEQLKKL
jgi:hypothetical protein